MRRNLTVRKLREMGAVRKLDIAFEHHFDELRKKIERASKRIGINLQDIGDIERLIAIFHGVGDPDTDDTNAEWNNSSWEERILATSFNCWLVKREAGKKSDKDLIDSLCLGNWAVGFLDGMPGTEVQNKCIPCMVKEAVENQRSIQAKDAANKKLANDPKQAEKSFVRECWNEWQNSPASYASQAAFARDMLSKCEHLTSQKKIEDWCREWKQRTSPS